MVEIKAYFCKACRAPLKTFHYSACECEYCGTINYKEGSEPIQNNDSGHKLPILIKIKNKTNKNKSVAIFQNNLHPITADVQKLIDQEGVEITMNGKTSIIEETDRLLESNFISSLIRVHPEKLKSADISHFWHYVLDSNGQVFENIIIASQNAYAYGYGPIDADVEINLRNTMCMLVEIKPNEELRLTFFAKQTITASKKAYALPPVNFGALNNIVSSGGSGGSGSAMAFKNNTIGSGNAAAAVANMGIINSIISK